MMSLSERLAALPSHKRAKLAAQLPPLSFAQQRLWFLDQLEPNSAFYNIPAAVRLSGPLNIAVLERTFTEIVRRHEALRTSFITIDGEARQLIAAPVSFSVPVVDLTTMGPELRTAEAEQLARMEARTPFDLSAGELLRVKVLRVAADEHVVLLTMHHIISDGWSMGVLIREVGTLYQAYSAGLESPLEELPIQYGDYARWQREWLQGEVLERQLAYWRRQLAELPVLQMPTDHTRPAVQTYNGSHHHFSIPVKVTEQLKDLSQQEGTTLFMVLLAAFQLLLSRYSGQEDIVVGTAIAGRNRAETENLIGCFVNTLVMRTDLSGGPTFKQLVQRVREVCLGAYAHQDVPFEKLVEELQPERDLSRSPLFQTMFVLQNASVKEQQASGALDMSSMGSETNTAQYDLVLTMIDDGQGTLEYNTDLFEAETVTRMCRHFERLLTELAADPHREIARVPMLSEAEREQILVQWNQTEVEYGPVECLHELFEQQVERTPHKTALLFEGQSLNYRELNERANQLARQLRACGVGPEVLVALCVSRSIEMVVALLAILKAGGAYLPLDAQYPVERLSFMLADADVGLLLTESGLRDKLPLADGLEVICLDHVGEAIAAESKQNVESGVSGDNLAYVIYTSGSTGRPKGVMIPHQCVINFFTGMDSALDFQEPGVWLALTGISFDISILELFWTLTRGFSVVVHREQHSEVESVRSQRPASQKPIDFSLFYFASDGSSRAGQRYRLLLEGARFADEHGFSAVWTPERHFHDFGGLYPNPSVSSAAIAAITKHVQIRAGSVVLPLHHPVRVAEEWSMVDNLSNGRVGISFASGWHAADFVFTPDRYARRKQIMMEEIETVRRLWRREAVEYTGGGGQPVQIRIMPPPIQPELPVWLTAAGNPETFEMAGQAGANLLTHLLGQSVEDLAGKIKIYRNAWKEAGHSGSGCVSLMLHTFVGERMDEVREQVRAPFTAYLASSLDLMRNLGRSLGINIDDKSLSEDDMSALLSHAFERYFETSGLLGTPEKCLAMLEQLQAIGVDEVACLIDFGVDHEAVLKSLDLLNEVKERSQEKSQESFDQYTIGEQLRNHRVTHVQCTPSMANMLEGTEESRNELGGVEKMLVGGEALSRSLAERLNACLNGRLFNMYGPTETTIWSATSEINKGDEITIGRPIANTQIHLLDGDLEPVAVGVSGELYIGGAGLARAYLNRAGLTAERFIPHPYSRTEGARLYRTGDVARYLADGRIEYLGRADEQVKLRGYRIELGEVEAVLERQAGVAECVVVVRGEADDKRLVAYVVAAEGATLSATELRAQLSAELPGYMVPGVYVMLPELPLTKNGKVDRRALPEPDASGLERSEQYVAPRTATEEILAGIWQRVLRVERVGVNDNFFELGGHSLLATQLVSRLREVFQVEVSLRSLFSSPTVAGLAGHIDESRHAESAACMPPPIKLVSRDGDLPLSFAQQRLWFLDQLEPNSAFYNSPATLRLNGPLNLAALERAFTEIVRRHEALRTRFVTVAGEARQLIVEPEAFKLPVIDLTTMAAELRSAEAGRLARAEAATPFDLSAGELLRVTVVRVSAEEHIALLTMHHIISDGWSMGVLIREVGALYQAYSEGKESPLEELPIQYADYAQWQREWLQGEVLEQQLAYWREQLAELPVLEIPTDHIRPAVQRYSGRRHIFTIPPELSQQLKELSQQEGATLFMVLLAAFQLLLSRYSGQEDIVVGTAIAGRNRAETENLIGCFVNSLVMRTDLSGGPTFKELVKRVREVSLGAYAHQEVPFEKLVEELQPERDLSRSPLFQTMFILQNTPRDTLQQFSGPTLTSQAQPGTTAKLDLLLSVVEGAEGLVGDLEYNTDLFTTETVVRMCRHFETLLRGVVAEPQRKIAHVPMLSAAEQEQILVEWNQTAMDHGAALCMHEFFEQQVDVAPDATALLFGEESVSYGELNERANQVAHYLRARGVGAEVPVALYLPRSVEMVVAVLGILKAGGAYVPLDVEYPAERVSFMVMDAGVKLLLTESGLVEKLPVVEELEVICLDQASEAIGSESVANVASGVSPENLAYVIYTSGSTGRPKGVMIRHGSVGNMLRGLYRELEVGRDEVWTLCHSYAFDFSVWELWGALLSGAQLLLVPQGLTRTPHELRAQLQQRGVTVLSLTPSAMGQLLRACEGEQWDAASGWSLRRVVVGGEALTGEIRAEVVRRGVAAWNFYGPTEATVWTTIEKLAESGKEGGIGRPIGNYEVYVLNRELGPVALGVSGELYIGGAGLARAYLHRPELTAERFIPHPYSRAEGARLYRTGDVARYLADGRIEYVGRADEQVKVRGYRIELGEIEAVLERQAGVAECVVVVRGEGAEKRLVAYVVAEAGVTLNVADLRAQLGKQLPAYMVPGVYVMLTELPLTKNGKVDRRALPEPAASGLAQSEQYAAPRTATEEILASIWQRVLRVERVGIHDNFFALGGHSLLATQLVSRMREVFGVEVAVRSLFEQPTVAGLAPMMAQSEGTSAPPMVARERTEALPLSFAQQRLWFLDQLEPNSAFYNIPAAVRLRGQLNLAALEQTFTEITRRHEMLRTHFVTVEGEARQLIADPVPFKVTVVDLTTMTEELRGAEAQRLAQVEAATPFDLSAGGLLRVKVLRVADEEHVVLLTMHHIISDGWSMGVLIREVGALYKAYSEEQESPLQELIIQYGDYARWQREWLQGEVLERQLGYWREQLAELPVLEIPTDHARPAVQSYSGRRASFTIPATVTQQLRDLSQQEGATLFMVLLAAFQLLLSRYSGQEDIVVGTAIAGRNRAETEGLIGCFVNTLVMRTDLSGGPTFKELLKRVREVSLGAYAHQEVPFEKLVEELQPERDPSRSPLVQVAFGLENIPKGEMAGVSKVRMHSFEFEVEVVRLDLTLWVMDGAGELSMLWTYNTDLFDSSTIARMQRHFETLLQSIVEQPETQIHDLSYISEAEREEQLLRKQERIAANRQQLQRIKRKGVTFTKDQVKPELIGTLTLQTVTQTEMDHEH